MSDTLFQAYTPLLFWTGLGILLFRFLPETLPRYLGRSLYWVGVPIQIFTLARQTDFADRIGLAPGATVTALFGGLALAWVTLQIVKRLTRASLTWRLRDSIAQSAIDAEAICASADPWQSSRRGSFILSAIIGNTGFVGLAIVPTLIEQRDLGWVVLYSITHNVVGSYGLGVFLASYYGRTQHQGTPSGWLRQIREVLTVPSLWAFGLGALTRSIQLPAAIESGLHQSIWVIIPCALLLMGMRLSQLQGWKSLRSALLPTLLKVGLIPCLVGLAATALRLTNDVRLALVLMSGMPTAFAGLILAEEYELDRELIASSIVLSTVLLLVTIPLWRSIFG